MHRINVTLAILALAQGILQADLHETEEQLERKYGAASNLSADDTDSSGGNREYSFGPYVINCAIATKESYWPAQEGRCQAQLIKRADGKKLTEAEIKRLLPTREFGGRWTYQGADKWIKQYKGHKLGRARIKDGILQMWIE